MEIAVEPALALISGILLLIQPRFLNYTGSPLPHPPWRAGPHSSVSPSFDLPGVYTRRLQLLRRLLPRGFLHRPLLLKLSL